jgi:hypothetical protein
MKVQRTFKDRHGVVHSVYVTNKFSVNARPQSRRANHLTCTLEDLYGLKVETKRNKAVTCLQCLVTPPRDP